MNEIELARFCEAAINHVTRTWPWGWRHMHADGTVCQERRLIYEVHPDDWTAAEVATFNATVKARLGETIMMVRDADMTQPGIFTAYLYPEPGLYPPGCPGRKLIRSSP